MQPLECKLFKILIAKLEPSIGSVPEPNSSNRIKLFEVDELNCHGGITYSNSLSHF